MELLAGLLLLIGSAQISSGQNCDHLCYEIPKNGFFLAGIVHSGSFLKDHCNCRVNNQTNGSIILNCLGGRFSYGKNCPKNTILAEVSANSGLQISITDGRSSSKSSTRSPNTLAVPHHNATTQAYPINAQNCNLYPWFIIGSQFLLLIMLLVAYLHLRRRVAMDNVPPPIKQSATPIEEIFDPTPSSVAFQHPSLLSEAVYEEPIVLDAKMREEVYEAYKLDSNDPLATQQYVHILDEQEDPKNLYYSTVKI